MRSWRVCCCALLVGMIGLSACSKKNVNQQPPMPKDFSLMFGEGGGITGVWQGHTIQADGTVLVWQGKTAGEAPQPAGKLSSKQMKSLWQQVHAANFFTATENDNGNLTTFMRVTANQQTHEASWTPQLGALAGKNSSLQQLYKFCRETTEKAAKKQ